MLFNMNMLPTTLWSVFTEDKMCDSTWTSRREARDQKQKLSSLGLNNVRILRRTVHATVPTVDLHS